LRRRPATSAVAPRLFLEERHGTGGNVVHGFGLDPYYTQLYFDEYGKVDPVAAGDAFGEIEEPGAIGDFIPYDRYLETPFLPGMARPQGLVDFVSCVLDKSATNALFFGVSRHERDGLVDDETRGRMRLVAPHVRRALSIAMSSIWGKPKRECSPTFSMASGRPCFWSQRTVASFTPMSPAAKSSRRMISSTPCATGSWHAMLQPIDPCELP